MDTTKINSTEGQDPAVAEATLTPTPDTTDVTPSTPDAAPDTAPDTAPDAAPDTVQKAAVKNKYGSDRKKRRRMPKWLKVIITLAIVAAIGAGVYFAVTKFLKKDEVLPTTAQSYRGSLMSNVAGYGTVVPKEKSDYGAKVRGKVTDVLVSAGDTVKIGDPLFIVDPSDLTKELTTARETQSTAALAVKNANEALANTTLVAPFNGKLIDAANIKVGDVVSAGSTKIGTLVDDSIMTLSLYFSHAYIDQITEGMTATVSVPQSMTTVVGTVSSVDRIQKISADGSMLFRVNISIPNPGTLTKDVTAIASITTASGEAVPAEGGKLDYISSRELTAKASGKVVAANILDYGNYRSGQTILTIDKSDGQAALAAAQKIYDEAAKKVSELEASFANSTIVSTMNGVVSSILVAVGDNLTASGTAVLSVSDTSSLFIDVNIDELDVNKIQIGMPVQITRSDSGEAWEGVLTYLSFEAKSSNQNGWGGGGAVAYFPAKISIENSGTLLPNMNVDFSITSLVKEDCLIVPASAIVYSDGGTIVFAQTDTLTGEETIPEVDPATIPKGFSPVTVEIGLSDAQNVEIVSGLSEGITVTTKQMSNEGGPGGGMGGGSFVIG